MKVLIRAEDNTIPELYARILKREGYEPIITEDLSDLLIRSKIEDIGAIVLDLDSPCNFSAISRLTDFPLLATDGDPDVEYQALEQGADYFIARPFEKTQDLVMALKKALQYHNRQVNIEQHQTEKLAVA